MNEELIEAGALAMCGGRDACPDCRRRALQVLRAVLPKLHDKAERLLYWHESGGAEVVERGDVLALLEGVSRARV